MVEIVSDLPGKLITQSLRSGEFGTGPLSMCASGVVRAVYPAERGDLRLLVEIVHPDYEAGNLTIWSFYDGGASYSVSKHPWGVEEKFLQRSKLEWAPK